MLKRLYIDNYKSFVNFEYKPSKCEVLIGDNGAGKSTLFEVLALLRAMIIEGQDTDNVLTRSALTRWQARDEQIIEIDVEGNNGEYHYLMRVHHDLMALKSVISQETLTFNGEPLITSETGSGKIQTLTLMTTMSHPAPHPVSIEFTLIDPTRSGLFFISQIDTLPDKIKWFIDWIRGLFVVRIDPYGMDSNSITDIEHPAVNMANFASWYRHLIQEKSEVINRGVEMLRQVLPGFQSISLQKEGEKTRVLKALYNAESKKTASKYDFNELSEGQRILIMLYILIGMLRDTPALFCIDEPDNYVALKEIQPWLQEIEALTEETPAQVLIISHHPEIINYFAPAIVRFYRQEAGPVRVTPFQITDANAGLLPAEIVARGWEDE